MKTPRSLEFPEKCISQCAFERAAARASCMVAPRWGLPESWHGDLAGFFSFATIL